MSFLHLLLVAIEYPYLGKKTGNMHLHKMIAFYDEKHSTILEAFNAFDIIDF